MLYKVYRFIRKLTAPIERIAELVPFNSSVLDLGCGKGVLTDEIISKKSPTRYTGVDIDKRNIHILRKRHPSFEFVLSDALDYLNICIENKISFDCIVISDMLYLLSEEKAEEIIIKTYSILSKNGIIIIKDAGHNLPLFIQEYISVKILHNTSGDFINLKPFKFYEGVLIKNSMNYIMIDVHRFWYPHFIVVIRK